MNVSDNSKKSKINYFIIFLLILLIALIIYLLLNLNFFSENDDIQMMSDILYIKVGDIKLLPYTVSEENNRIIIFESTDENIARIDNQGYIYALQLGEVFVNARFEDDTENIKKCKVKVVLEYGGGTLEQDEGTDYEGENDNKKEGDDEIGEKEEKPVTPPPDNTVKVKPSCKLSVSKDGIVTAQITNAIKYGFVKNNLDNVKSMHVKNIPNKDVKDYEGWKYYKINYYVLSEDETKSCSIIVIEKCNKGTNVCIYEKN